MRACTAPSCRSPTASIRRLRWLLGELCAAAGVRVAEGAPGAAARPALGSRGPPRPCSRATRSWAGRSTSTGASPRRPRRSRRAPRRSTTSCSRCARRPTRAGVEPAPVYPGRRPLRRRADARHRHALALEQRGLLGAGRAAQGRARAPATRRRPRASRRTGLALAPLHRLRGSDPNWSLAPLRRARARVAGSARPASCSRRIATRTTARRPEAYAERRARLVRRARPARARGRAARELHLPRRRAPARRASAPSSRACSAGRSRGNRHHYLRLPLARGHPRARPPRLRLRHDARLRGAPRPAGRALVPVPALGRRRRARRCASSSCRSC